MRHPGFGFLDLLHLQGEAWLTERAAAAEVKILDARRRVAQAAEAAEAAEARTAARRVVGRRGLDLQRAITSHEVEMEGLLLERDRLQAQRREARRLPEPGRAALSGGAEPHIDDREIEALAVKAVARFGRLDGNEAESAWAAWREELRKRFPRYAAAEVERRAAELRALSRASGR